MAPSERPETVLPAASGQIDRPALHQELAERLRDMIVQGTLAGGESLNERELCAHFGVSRTPLREAMLVLASEGLIELIPRYGARVAMQTPDRVREVLDLLGGIEALAGELACERASKAEIAEIEAMHAEMCDEYKAGNMLRYFKINEGIHDAIVAATHNATLVTQHRIMRGRVLHALYLPNIRAARWEAALGEHEAFIDALVGRDGPRLARLLRAHKHETWRALRDCMEHAVAPQPSQRRN